MIMNITIEDLGVEDMLDEIEKDIRDGLERGVALGGEFVKGSARAKAPVDTGQLRSSISSQASGFNCVVGTNVEYGIYQEFGTYKMPPHPFLIPALEENENEIVNRIRDNIK